MSFGADNLGVESLFKPGEGLREGTDYLIVCDASRPLSSVTRQSRWRPGYLTASMRLITAGFARKPLRMRLCSVCLCKSRFFMRYATWFVQSANGSVDANGVLSCVDLL